MINSINGPQMRKSNICVLLSEIKQNDPLSKRDLQDRTGLSWGAISSITAMLPALKEASAKRVEKDRDHYAFICKIMQELKTDKCLPIRGDVFKYLKSGREQFDFIFADPPYELAGLETLPDLIFENNLLKEDGLFVLEHGKKNSFEEHPHFVERRVYGSVNFTIFK